MRKRILRPSLGSLSDPLDLPGMPEAVEVVTAAVRAGTTVLVHGDYDVDLARLRAAETTEILANFHGPLVRLGRDGRSVAALLTSHDVRLAARSRGLTLVPDTLAECMQPRPAASAKPLEVGSAGGSGSRMIAVRARRPKRHAFTAVFRRTLNRVTSSPLS